MTKYTGKNKKNFEILKSGVDSLYLYLSCEKAINFDLLSDLLTIHSIPDVVFKYRGLNCFKTNGYMKLYPVSMQIEQFIFYVNKETALIKVLSLGFEMHGFTGIVNKLCKILDQLKRRADKNYDWLNYLKVYRIDVYVDFKYNHDFDQKRFRTKLRKSGYFRSGDNEEGITYYFGSRNTLMIRLYVKSAEIEKSGKLYLKSTWKEKDCEDDRIWRLEFEFHKDKIMEVCHSRELSIFNDSTLKKLLSYGVRTLEYVTESKDQNKARRELHSIWIELQEIFIEEYELKIKQYKRGSVDYRYKRARPWLISWLVAQDIEFENIPEQYQNDFKIGIDEYEEKLEIEKAKLDAYTDIQAEQSRYFENDSTDK